MNENTPHINLLSDAGFGKTVLMLYGWIIIVLMVGFLLLYR